MLRNNDKDAYFFSHDCNARNDPNILALRSVYGAEGYGVYWMLIEILREQPGYKLAVNKYTWATLAMQMQMDAARLEQIVEDCCSEFVTAHSSLFVKEDGYLFSQSLLRRMKKMDDISRVRSDAARKRWGKDANGEQMDAKRNEMKENERKGNERKGNETKPQDPFGEFACGDVELMGALRDFEEMRMRIKKPLTLRAKKLLLTELKKLSPYTWEQIDILNQSITRCWAGVFPLDGEKMSQSDKLAVLGGLYDQE